jgi:hypothetical protein
MKYLLIISCLLFTSVGWSKDINSDDLVERDGLFYEKFMDVPFTGNSIGIEQGKISKGKRQGKWLEYYENGQLKLKSNYKNGEYEGEQLGYYKNGQLWVKINYKDGKLEGEFLVYNENGQLEKTEIWKDDKLIETITP